jgi:hypothetical protein
VIERHGGDREHAAAAGAVEQRHDDWARGTPLRCLVRGQQRTLQLISQRGSLRGVSHQLLLQRGCGPRHRGDLLPLEGCKGLTAPACLGHPGLQLLQHRLHLGRVVRGGAKSLELVDALRHLPGRRTQLLGSRVCLPPLWEISGSASEPGDLAVDHLEGEQLPLLVGGRGDAHPVDANPGGEEPAPVLLAQPWPLVLDDEPRTTGLDLGVTPLLCLVDDVPP